MEKTITIIPQSVSYTISSKVKDYFILIKFTLSFMVVFSSVVCYLLAPNVEYNLLSVIMLFFAGLCITGSANAINQTVERKTDALMKRTADRPVAAGRMSVNEANTFAAIAGAVGVIIMWYWFNFESAMLSLFSLFLYAYIYTPLKRVNAVSVIVGAFPGALPCLIGWVAGTGYLNPFASFQGLLHNGEVSHFMNYGGYILFAIQFLWQFPHFWAIAWLAHKDYDKAGFKLLPSREGTTKFSAMQTVIYSMMMVPVGMLPYYFHIGGILSFWVLLFCNLWMVFVSVLLVIKMNAAAARRVMFSSYFYLMIVFLTLLFDKI
ncbi:MAG: protoheme IX farnesyltransferase [Bacteroidota bacterium]|nr:protoheme IX farnesyltransferase [Bacteroidota bacterium]